MLHIYASVNWVSFGSDNGLSPIWRQAIIWTNAGILLIRTLGANFSEIFIGNQAFSFKKIHLKMLSVKWRPFCPGEDELTHWGLVMHVHASMTWITIVLGNGWWLCSAKPLSEPMLTQWQNMDPYEHNSVRFKSRYNHFLLSECIWKCCLQNVNYLVQVSMYHKMHVALTASQTVTIFSKGCSMFSGNFIHPNHINFIFSMP